MANMATIVRTQVEPYVRNWLKSKFGQSFQEVKLDVVTGVTHKADAVSVDGTIVADILSNRSITSGGNRNTGGERKAENDFWKLANATNSEINTRLLVFTDTDFKLVFENLIGDPRRVGVSFLYCKLPENIQQELDAALDEASREQQSGSR